MGYLKMGDSVEVWGRLSRDASFHEFGSGAMVTSFSVKYAFDEKLYGDGNGRTAKFMDVKAWGREDDRALCDYAACLEKGDRVTVRGTLTLDKKKDRDGNDRWYLNAEFIEVQQTVQIEDDGAVFSEEDPAPEEPLPREFSEEDYPEVLQ